MLSWLSLGFQAVLDGVQCSKPGMLKVARVSYLLHRLFEEEQGVEERDF